MNVSRLWRFPININTETCKVCLFSFRLLQELLILVVVQGSIRWCARSLFSGRECFREALAILKTAVANRFGIDLNMGYGLMVPQLIFNQAYFGRIVCALSQANSYCWLLQVEKNKACRMSLSSFQALPRNLLNHGCQAYA